MDRLENMSAFVAVADLHGFAPAARRLNVSPSALTRMIAGLEEHLGLRLFQRTTRSVSLTDAGVRYLERVRRILADVEEAEQAALAERTVPTGRLTVTAPAAFGRIHVAPMLSTYLRKHPAVSAELTLSDRIVNLVEDGIDVAVRIGALEDSSLVARAVGATRRVLVAAPAYLRKHKLRSVDELPAHTTIVLSSLHARPEWTVFVDGQPRQLTLTPRFVTNSADAAIGQAELGGGVTMVLAYQVRDAVRAGRLRVVLPELEPPPLPIHLVFPTSRLLSAKVRGLVEHVLATCTWNFVEL